MGGPRGTRGSVCVNSATFRFWKLEVEDVFQTYALRRGQAGGRGQQQGKGQGLAQIQLPVSRERIISSSFTRLTPTPTGGANVTQEALRRMTPPTDQLWVPCGGQERPDPLTIVNSPTHSPPHLITGLGPARLQGPRH